MVVCSQDTNSLVQHIHLYAQKCSQKPWLHTENAKQWRCVAINDNDTGLADSVRDNLPGFVVTVLWPWQNEHITESSRFT